MKEILLFWLLPIIGIVYVLGYSMIFHPIRVSKKSPELLRDLLSCPMCIAFWVGLFVGAVNEIPINWPGWIQWPLIGAVSAIGVEYILELARSKGDGDER
jgi:hypothetical protein